MHEWLALNFQDVVVEQDNSGPFVVVGETANSVDVDQTVPSFESSLI